MKRNNIILGLLMCLSVGNLAFAASGTIQHVEVYPAGAAVTREIVVEPSSAGTTVVEIGDLPSTVIASSFQISPTGGNSLRVGSFTFLPQGNPVEEDDPRTRDLRERVENISDEQRLFKEERRGIESRITHYDYTVQSIRKSLEEDADVDTFDLIQSAWAAYEKVRNEGQVRLAELAKKEQLLAIKMKQAHKDLNKLVNKLRRKSGVLRFDLSGDIDKKIRLLVRYQVREAGWSPVHEIRANPADEKVTWIYKARIHQSSGEEWKNVQISLNSARALYGDGLPTLNPLIISRVEARPRGSYLSKKATSTDAEVFEISPYEMRGADKAGYAPPKAESTTTGFFIHLPESLSLESGKEPVVREAIIGDIKAQFWSEGVPELSNEAWLVAGIINELGWPILAGESYSYIDGQLVSRRHIESVASGAEMEFSLGRNEKISIERKERVKKESEGGLIDRTKRRNIKYETTVTNHMSVAHRVVLQDRFPVGRDNKIQVRITSPKDVEPEEGTGIFKWEKTPEAGGKAVLTTEYTVTYPGDWMIHPSFD